MKGKDNRIVTISLPTSQGSSIIFNAKLSDLEDLYREAIKSNMKEISFTYGESSTEISTKQLKDIILSAIKQYDALKMIPSSLLNNYLVSNSANVAEKIVGREQEIDRIWAYLMSTQKCNAILIGDHGVGKTTIAAEIIRQINSRECPQQFRKYHVVTLNTAALLELLQKSTFRYELVLKKIHEFVKENKGKVIFYIDNFLHIKCDLSLLSFFRKWLFNYNIKFIASINDRDFEDYFVEDTELMKYLNELLVEKPDVDEIRPIIESKISSLQSMYKVAIKEKMISFAISTAGFHGNLNVSNPERTIDAINFALSDARKKGQKEVTKENFFTYYKINFRDISKMHLETILSTTYHEIGHYLVGILSPNLKNFKFDNVSILPTEEYLGVTVHRYDISQVSSPTKEYFIDYIAYVLGGRVGEMYYTNAFSAGASSDLTTANELAEQAVLSLGLTGVGGEENKTYMIMGYPKDYLLTEDNKKEINKEIYKLLQEGYKRAQDIINSHKELFDELVQKLFEDKILVHDELNEICKKYNIS